MTLDELYIAQLKEDSYQEEFYMELLEFGRALLGQWYGSKWKIYEDALQDLMVNLIDPNKSKPNGTASFRTWFHNALERRCTQFRYDESREHSIEQMPENTQALYRPKNYNEVIQTIDLRQRMNVLTSIERRIVNLAIEGHTQPEIANKLRLYPMKVSRMYQCAIQKLRDTAVEKPAGT